VKFVVGTVDLKVWLRCRITGPCKVGSKQPVSLYRNNMME